MEEINTIRAKIRHDIEQIDGGFRAVSVRLGISEQSLHKTLNPKQTKRPRIETLEAIKTAVLQCQEKQQKRLAALNA